MFHVSPEKMWHNRHLEPIPGQHTTYFLSLSTHGGTNVTTKKVNAGTSKPTS